MTIEHAQARVERIRQIASKGDYERAHRLENSLHHDFVIHVAKGREMNGWYLAEIARVIKTTQEIPFSRHCA